VTPVSCAPRQRALGPSREAAWSPRAPPGRPESQLGTPDSWARQRDPRLSVKQSPLRTFFVTYPDCLARALRAETRSVGVDTDLSAQFTCLLKY
jgi:hypothetical protein